MSQNKASNAIEGTNAYGEVARLIPALAEVRKEERVTSTTLSVLSSVHEFGQGLLKAVGAPTGKRAQICPYTEITFDPKNQRKGQRPDGLIVVRRGSKKPWTALVEAKIGNSDLDAKQVESYVDLAREQDIDAVITISNQYAARVDHHPVSITKTKLRKVSLYHWSWMHLLTEALLHVENNGIADPDQVYILGEWIRYLDHPKAGVLSNLRMPREWKDIVASGHRKALTRSTPGIDDAVAAWQELTRVLSMTLSTEIGRPVSVHLPSKHAKDPSERSKHDDRLLREKYLFEDYFKIPNAADNLHVLADLAGRCVSASMTLKAPGDRKRASATVTWLLNQLDKSSAPSQLWIGAKWPSRMPDARCRLAELRDDREKILAGRDGHMPSSFQVLWLEDMGGNMAKPNVFVEAVERASLEFYREAGQYLSQWVPKAPKVKERKPEPIVESEAVANPAASVPTPSYSDSAANVPALPWGTFIRPS